jgi:hypothetical protein
MVPNAEMGENPGTDTSVKLPNIAIKKNPMQC